MHFIRKSKYWIMIKRNFQIEFKKNMLRKKEKISKNKDYPFLMNIKLKSQKKKINQRRGLNFKSDYQASCKTYLPMNSIRFLITKLNSSLVKVILNKKYLQNKLSRPAIILIKSINNILRYLIINFFK